MGRQVWILRIATSLAVIAIAGGGAALGLNGGASSGGQSPEVPSVGAPFAVPEDYTTVGGMDLVHVPWLWQPDGSPKIDAVDNYPSVEFPPGTTLSAALDSLYQSVAGDGKLPAGVTVLAPLPKGRVLQLTGPGGGIRISLTAPYGWDPETRNVTPPSFFGPKVSAAEFDKAYSQGKLLPAGLHSPADLPRECQVLRAGASLTPATC